MSFRGFEGKSHAEVYKKYRERPPKELIERIISYLKDKYKGKLNLAVDLGCGSGQCTFLLTEHFDKVLGTDISPAQIEEANKDLKDMGLKNVSFSIAPAEQIPVADQSVQMVTICTAFHWLDSAKVYEEGRRVICPGGVMAIFCPEIPKFVIANDSSKNDAMNEITAWVDGILLEYFAPPVQLVLDKYKDIEIPYSDFIREYGFQDDKTVSLFDIIGNVKSYSGFQKYCKVKGEDAGQDLLNTLQNKFATLAGLSEVNFGSPLFVHVRKYFLLMARA